MDHLDTINFNEKQYIILVFIVGLHLDQRLGIISFDIP